MSKLFLASWRFALLLGVASAVQAAAIAVDVGHYHASPGAISARGVPEFEYNLRLARDVAEALRQAGHRVLLIGDDGLAVDLHGRAPRAQGADLFISLHHDSVQPHYLSQWEHEGVTRSYSDRYAGYSVFVSRRNPRVEASLKCASAIGAALRRSGYAASRYHAEPIAGENRPFADEANGVHYFDNLVVLRTATVPALLLEAGVIVHRDEELRLRDPVDRRKIAEAIASAAGKCLKN